MNQAADALSRLATAGVKETELEDEILVILVGRTRNHVQKKPTLPRRAQKKKPPRNNSDQHDAGLHKIAELIIALSEEMFCEKPCQLAEVTGSSFIYRKQNPCKKIIYRWVDTKACDHVIGSMTTSKDTPFNSSRTS